MNKADIYREFFSIAKEHLDLYTDEEWQQINDDLNKTYDLDTEYLTEEEWKWLNIYFGRLMDVEFDKVCDLLNSICEIDGHKILAEALRQSLWTTMRGIKKTAYLEYPNKNNVPDWERMSQTEKDVVVPLILADIWLHQVTDEANENMLQSFISNNSTSLKPNGWKWGEWKMSSSIDKDDKTIKFSVVWKYNEQC